ncbi:hypothetical protein J8273_6850 [Carpediemonas membranifera]|uniref:Uncharacterized protein n=1 Tax=Carpediemonas membranifera TaxID=201153 RepID=A0A8J6E2F3_9EUKA|nr:hypothetical protein J8273_6850 [Carpediemonas membranifera]|eukprot:KAG9391837.1 hypothetical protein J8273_6850 [Carpediemonas membranifera]
MKLVSAPPLVGELTLQSFAYLFVLINHWKRKYITIFTLLAVPVGVVALVYLSADSLSTNFDVYFEADSTPSNMTQRWSQVSAAAHSPKSSEPEPFTVFYAEDAGVDVGKLDDSGASGFLAGIENSTINGVVSPRFVPASEAAANTFFLDSWDNHNETLGAVVFSKADSTGLDVKILVNDTVTQPNSAGSFSSTHLLPLNDMLTNAWLQTVSPALSYVSHSTADYPRGGGRGRR